MSKPAKTKSRKRSLILRVLAILVVIAITLGGAGWYLVWQFGEATLGNQIGSYAEKWPHVLLSVNEDQAEYDEEFEALLNDYPDLKPNWKELPDEQNGFLQLLDLSDYMTGANRADAEYRISLPDDFRKSLSEGTWDKDKLVDEASMDLLLNELYRIGMMTEQSCAGIDKSRYIFPNVTFTRRAVTILTDEAKAAADLGNKDRALKNIYAASGIVSHLSQIETMSLFGATIAIVCEMQVSNAVFEDLLPNIEYDNADLRKLRSILTANDEAFTSVKLMSGEFNLAMPNLIMSCVDDAKLCQLIGRDRIHRAVANYNLALINGFKDQPDSIFLDSEKTDAIFQAQRGQASFLEKRIQDFFGIGLEAFIKGTQRSSVMRNRGDAAFAHLMGEEMPVELITGKPYVLDEQAKTLSLPDDALLEDLENEPLKLP